MKNFKSVWSRKYSFFTGYGWEGSKLLGLRTVFTLCTPSTHKRTFQMDAQHNKRQKIIVQLTKTCKASSDDINLPLQTVKRLQ